MKKILLFVLTLSLGGGYFLPVKVMALTPRSK